MINLNEVAAKKFLAEQKITNCEIKKIAGDASFRSYYRVFCSDKNFILMFAPPSYERIDHFIKIDKFLVENNFSAPKIFAIDEKEGFILLEDFGDKSYSRVLAVDISQEFFLYKNACDCLIELGKVAPPQGLAVYNHDLLFREVMLLVDWYLPHQKNIIMNIDDIAQFKRLWFGLFDLLNQENKILVLRDFHADNLMLLANKKNYQSVGLLDFQDAVIGSAAYDLVSLLEDARRDVLQNTVTEILKYYLAQTKCNAEAFMLDYEILSLQRNIKILGIFSRLAARDSKPHYLNLLPRVRNFVNMRLASSNPALQEMANFLKQFI